MSETETVHIEVVYALPEKQRLLNLDVPVGTTAREAVRLSELVEEFPGLDVERCPLGIFGKEVDDDRQLMNGERVEIYRPLINDPREARRKLAASGATMGSGNKSAD